MTIKQWWIFTSLLIDRKKYYNETKINRKTKSDYLYQVAAVKLHWTKLKPNFTIEISYQVLIAIYILN